MAEGAADRPARTEPGHARQRPRPGHGRVLPVATAAGDRFRRRAAQRPDLGPHRRVMAPLDYETDREMLAAALGTIGLVEPADAKLLWIADTLHLDELECSAAYLAEAREREDLEILTAASRSALRRRRQLCRTQSRHLEVERVGHQPPEARAQREPIGVDAGLAAKPKPVLPVGIVDRHAGLVGRAHRPLDAGVRIGLGGQFAAVLVESRCGVTFSSDSAISLILLWSVEEGKPSSLMSTLWPSLDEVAVGLVDDQHGFEPLRIADLAEQHALLQVAPRFSGSRGVPDQVGSFSSGSSWRVVSGGGKTVPATRRHQPQPLLVARFLLQLVLGRS